MDPVNIYAAPMENAAAADWGVAMPPASPTHKGSLNLYFSMNSFLSASMVGNKDSAGRLSVCPPESASAVKS